MTYQFVHAADLHLDSPLRSLALRNPDLAELIGNATRRALVGIVDLCLNEQVDALLLAGDLYDGDQTSMKTARFLAEQIRRLDQAGVRVFIIRGNHDALSRITKELTLPETVKVFGGRAEAIAVERPNGAFAVAMHGISFPRPHAPDSLLPKYKAPIEGTVNIALMHTSLAGAPGHDLYAPCNVNDLSASGFHYWALGHVHKRAVPHGGCAIVMPGMPQGRDISEAGPKSVTLVRIADDRSVHLEERFTSIAQFERVAVSLNGIDNWRDMVAAIAKALESARHRVISEHLVVRLALSGTTPLAWQIRRDGDLLKTEADDQASAAGKTWIEKVEIDCIAPTNTAGPAADPLIELRALIANEIIQSSSYEVAMTDIAEELRALLPQECRSIVGDDEAMFKAVLADLAREGAEDVLAQLHARAKDAEA